MRPLWVMTLVCKAKMVWSFAFNHPTYSMNFIISLFYRVNLLFELQLDLMIADLVVDQIFYLTDWLIVRFRTWSQNDLESILPNFFLRKTKIFSMFCYSGVPFQSTDYIFLCYKHSSLKWKSKKRRNQSLVGLTPDPS